MYVDYIISNSNYTRFIILISLIYCVCSLLVDLLTKEKLFGNLEIWGNSQKTYSRPFQFIVTERSTDPQLELRTDRVIVTLPIRSPFSTEIDCVLVEQNWSTCSSDRLAGG